MERIRRICCDILVCSSLLTSISITAGCHTEDDDVCLELRIQEESYSTKAIDPDEDKIEDVCIFIFNEGKELEERIILDPSDLEQDGNYRKCDIILSRGKVVDIYACANLGYVPDVCSLEDIRKLRCHLSYPDDYRNGIPMCCIMENIKAIKDRVMVLEFERLMSKISVRLDRSHLDKDVKIHVNSVKIGHCPKKADVFNKNTIIDGDDLFANGFVRTSVECRPLNENTGEGLSRDISLYMLENIQGILEYADGSPEDKIFQESDKRSGYASYIEISMDYISPQYFTDKKELVYRFLPGKDNKDINIERNSHYHITIRPENDGLGADGWRIDKTGLKEVAPETNFNIMPSKYIEGRVGDDVHIWCEYSPSYASFDIGIEELENDKARGIYDYTIDPDGKGVILHLLRRGQGILYMSAGDPVNESDIAYIEIMD